MKAVVCRYAGSIVNASHHCRSLWLNSITGSNGKRIFFEDFATTVTVKKNPRNERSKKLIGIHLIISQIIAGVVGVANSRSEKSLPTRLGRLVRPRYDTTEPRSGSQLSESSSLSPSGISFGSSLGACFASCWAFFLLLSGLGRPRFFPSITWLRINFRVSASALVVSVETMKWTSTKRNFMGFYQVLESKRIISLTKLSLPGFLVRTGAGMFTRIWKSRAGIQMQADKMV